MGKRASISRRQTGFLVVLGVGFVAVMALLVFGLASGETPASATPFVIGLFFTFITILLSVDGVRKRKFRVFYLDFFVFLCVSMGAFLSDGVGAPAIRAGTPVLVVLIPEAVLYLLGYVAYLRLREKRLDAMEDGRA